MSEAIVPVPLADIVVGERTRKEFKHITVLAESIRAVGLLHPVVLNGRKELVSGGRRLEAVKRLGWSEIPARVVCSLDDVLAALRAERDENTCRENLTPTELVELGRKIEELEKPKAKERQKAGGGIPGSGKLPEPEPPTRDKVASALGVSGRTYEKAKQVVEAAEREPEKFGDLPAKMDAASVHAAHTEMRERETDPTPSEEWHTPPLWDDDEPPEDADQVSDDAGPPEVESDFVDESDEDRGQPADRITAESLARLEHEYAERGDYEAAAECRAERQELESVLDAGDGAPVNRVPRKKLPKGFKPGNHVDPDHPFADVLNGMSAFAAKVTAALKHEKYGQQLIEYLSHCRFLTHTGERYVDGEIVPAKARFTALKWFRRVIHLAGLPGKRLDKEGLLKRLKGRFDDEPEFLAEDFE